MTSQAWRRRVLAASAGENIRAAAAKIAGERGCSYVEAEAAVFADPALLQECHNVPGVQMTELPKSSVDAQNRAISPVVGRIED